MMIHLDTSFLVRALLRDTPEALALDSWIGRGETVGISSIAWSEFLCWPINGEIAVPALVVLAPPSPFLAEDATLAAAMFNATGRRRGSLPDCMIAAVAIRAGATIATSNLEDFRRFTAMGLVLATP
jgi:predicted nucleic acid-binding protein